MTLFPFRFNYKRIDTIDDISKETKTRYYPLLPCRFRSGGKKTPGIEGLLDSGSDGIVMPLSLAEYLGLELSEAAPMKVAGGEDIERYVSTVTLILGRGGRNCEPINDVEVSVPRKGEPPVLLGRSPVFELYIVTFIEAEKRYKMEPYTDKKRGA